MKNDQFAALEKRCMRGGENAGGDAKNSMRRRQSIASSCPDGKGVASAMAIESDRTRGDADEVTDGHGSAVLLAELPLVVGSLETGGQFAQIVEGVAAQAGQEAVDEKDGGNDGDEPGEEEAVP